MFEEKVFMESFVNTETVVLNYTYFPVTKNTAFYLLMLKIITANSKALASVSVFMKLAMASVKQTKPRFTQLATR